MKELAQISRLFAAIIIAGWAVSAAGAVEVDGEGKIKPLPGLRVAFRSGSETDVTSRPEPALFVAANEPASWFVPAGKFDAEWTGWISLDLRSEYTFHAQFVGVLFLEINGMRVLEGTNATFAMAASRRVKLNKGTNAFRASYQSGSSGGGRMRIEWAARGGLPFPIPSRVLSHAEDGALLHGEELRIGRRLFLEHRCFKCHDGLADRMSVPEMALDGPSFTNLGARLKPEWLAGWILNPKKERPGARMPVMFHGVDAVKDAQAAAAFLSSLSSVPLEKSLGGDAAAGRQLFEKLHCGGCHGEEEGISLRHVGKKFWEGALRQYLKAPDTHYAWSRMPDFNLTEREAGDLAAYLEGESGTGKESEKELSARLVDRGRTVVQRTGCLNCHPSELGNEFRGRRLAAPDGEGWEKGCLSAQAEGKAPVFSLTEQERRAIRMFAGREPRGKLRHAPAEFALAEAKSLRCGECHGKITGFPRLELIGNKLKPEWVQQLLAGEISDKPRPWLESRMPNFRSRARLLAEGLAALHGHPPISVEEGEIDPKMAETGRKLVSAAGGFSCISCHAVGEMAATQVFEGAGINLVLTGDRLLKPFYKQWILNPLLFDPTTKMPAYFDEAGRSPLTEFYDGDGLKQVDAMWEYIRRGRKMEPPMTE